VSGFTEFTYTDGSWEVMVHHDSRGKVIALYTDRETAHEINGTNLDGVNGKPLRAFYWQDGQNPLFVHLHGAEMRRFVREFIDTNELVCIEREETE
jgi:hypothetical protein